MWASQHGTFLLPLSRSETDYLLSKGFTTLREFDNPDGLLAIELRHCTENYLTIPVGPVYLLQRLYYPPSEIIWPKVKAAAESFVPIHG